QRELLRPAEPVRARPGAAGSTGWKLPLAPGSISALFEKEARTVVRLGWLQLVVVPVAYLLLVHAVLPGPQPLLVAAVYAHLGVSAARDVRERRQRPLSGARARRAAAAHPRRWSGRRALCGAVPARRRRLGSVRHRAGTGDAGPCRVRRRASRAAARLPGSA